MGLFIGAEKTWPVPYIDGPMQPSRKLKDQQAGRYAAAYFSGKGHMLMVYQTVGNRTGLTGYRSNRSGPVPVWSGMKPAKF